jgi:cyanophycin synthetase
VGEAIISSMFKSGQNGRIPIVAVTGTNGKTTTVRLISHLFTQNGLCVGMTNTDGVYVGGQCIDTGDCSGPKSARNVLLHPDVDAAVLETARGGVLREGLAFDRCDVAVVTNVGSGDHLGLNYITTVQDLAVLKRVIVQNVSTTGVAVLNATDPTVAHGQQVPRLGHLFCRRQVPPGHGHAPRPGAGRGVCGKRPHRGQPRADIAPKLPWPTFPSPWAAPLIPFQVENAMASVAAAWALGLDWDTIRHGLAGFSNDADNAQGRFNLFHVPRCHRDCRLWPQPRRHGGPGAGGAGHARQTPLGGHQRCR